MNQSLLEPVTPCPAALAVLIPDIQVAGFTSNEGEWWEQFDNDKSPFLFGKGSRRDCNIVMPSQGGPYQTESG